MPPLSDEERAALPYQLTDKPAEAMDVAEEVTRLIALIASVAVARSSLSGGIVRMINDGTKEPGRSVVIQQMRLAMALDSWVRQAGQEVLLTIATVFEEQVSKLGKEP